MKRTYHKRKNVSASASLHDAASHLFAASLHMPSGWSRTKVREWAEAALMAALEAA